MCLRYCFQINKTVYVGVKLNHTTLRLFVNCIYNLAFCNAFQFFFLASQPKSRLTHFESPGQYFEKSCQDFQNINPDTFFPVHYFKTVNP